MWMSVISLTGSWAQPSLTRLTGTLASPSPFWLEEGLPRGQEVSNPGHSSRPTSYRDFSASPFRSPPSPAPLHSCTSAGP